MIQITVMRFVMFKTLEIVSRMENSVVSAITRSHESNRDELGKQDSSYNTITEALVKVTDTFSQKSITQFSSMRTYVLINENIRIGENSNSCQRVKVFQRFVDNDGIHLSTEGPKLFVANIKFLLRKTLDHQLVKNASQNNGYIGISPNQSSRQIPITKDQDIYKSANNLAYVIRTHLNDPKECADDGSESQYFRLLTEPQSYKFEFKDKTDKTEVLVTCNNDDKPFPILKAPEGILEAKIMSITLSNRRTTTLLIDEPGRGMHPSMIDCLRDLVLYDVNKNEAKTVIFTTHNERFICPWTFEKIFYFYACENGSKVVTLGHALEEVKRRYSVHKSKENQVDIKPYFWREQVTPIFFSKRVIMVEGPEDNRFLGAFKNILLTDEARRSSVCKRDPDIDMNHKLRKFLTSLHIIGMGGKSSVSGIEPLCQALNLTQRKRRYYLFDSDALKCIKSSIMRTDLIKSDIEDQKLEKLEENGIFVWFAYTNIIVENFENPSDLDVHLKRYGRLEEAIVEFSNTHDQNHHEKIKNCTVHNCMGMNTMLKNIGIDVSDKRNPQKKKPFELNNINYVEMREITTRIIDISMLYGDNCFYEKTNFMCPFKRLFQFLINQAKRP
ncbi:unnamed protein product [Mytilus edulis]|uniref:ATPase AAA-type core domain-containing protein n=1 Tax=Mytilus edulis TaxID=6550 RepID=A0A8S3RJK7_MYTED|nr:unnamed protein product [Mytilus edulis]